MGVGAKSDLVIDGEGEFFVDLVAESGVRDELQLDGAVRLLQGIEAES